MPAVSIVSYLLAACALLLLLSEVGAGSGSRRTLLGYVAATVALAYTGAIVQDASAAERLSASEARRAAVRAAVQTFSGFTERQPTVTARCGPPAGVRARCTVEYRGDRLRARVNARITELADGYRVTLGHLELLRPKPKPKPWKTALASWYQLTGSSLGCPPYKPMDTTTLGVAHKGLACGTRVRIAYRGRYVTAIVNDRGPYVGPREFDLSGAVRNRLGFDGIGTIRWRRARAD